MGLGLCSDFRREPHKLWPPANAPDEMQAKELTVFNEKRESSIEKRDSSGNNVQAYKSAVLKLETSNSVASYNIATEEASNVKVLIPEAKLHISELDSRNPVSIDGNGQLVNLTSGTGAQIKKRDSEERDSLTPIGVKEEVRSLVISPTYQSGKENPATFSRGSSVRQPTNSELRELGLIGANSSLILISPKGCSSAEPQQKESLAE